MTSNKTKKPGALALVGSGEYSPAMNETDRYLLETVGGPASARVVIMATASGLEDPSSPARWTKMGLDHFERLGARVDPAGILKREDTNNPRWLDLLEGADFYYFSGGNPQHVIETMRDTPAWEIIQRNWQSGAVVAGCSAGAMAMSGYTANIRAMAMGNAPGWVNALGLVPRVTTMPHFDRMAQFVGEARFQEIVSHAPPTSVLVGVDEDTALVLTGQYGDTANSQRWQVMGNQTVSLFDSQGQRNIYKSGEFVPLEEV